MPSNAQMNEAELTSMMRAILANGLLPVGEEFTVDDNLFDAGLDSMAVAQLLLEVESRVGIWLDESLLTQENLATCRSLASCISGALAARRIDGESGAARSV